ncbi:TetR/AcrR family transcriptional regulator [Leucobacter sp. NPDC058333]|uniref:TetR/AcrR family transcriptional regulator n=1 Tax=Leucobacter sp. NPDC058333 TaxID=3346450 RepID=UPI0036665798
MPRPRSESARQAVLAAMRSAVVGEGYEALTIEGLAAEAGVSKQTIYRWWPTKAAILGEALVEGALPQAIPDPPTAEQPAADQPAPDLATELVNWLTGSAQQLGRAEGLGVARALIAVTASDPEVGAALNERLAAPVREWVQQRVELATARGEVREGVDAILLADHLIAFTAYAALTGAPQTESRIRATVTLLLTGIT